MKCLMALNQRRWILESLPQNGKMLEWGGGGSTGWFVENLGPGQRLCTVEHHAGWADSLRGAYGGSQRWTLHHFPATLEVGQNATHWEECPAGLADYICPPSLGGVNVALVDGVARSACMTAAITTMRTGIVYVHDVQRSWYDWPLRVFADRIVSTRVIEPDDGDYPAKLMEIRL